jgi:hypothetical protein
MKCGKYDKMILKHQLEKDNKSARIKLLNCWYKERATGLVASTTLRACCPYVNNNNDSVAC